MPAAFGIDFTWYTRDFSGGVVVVVVPGVEQSVFEIGVIVVIVIEVIVGDDVSL
jgi:hypothetical protein